MLAEAAERRAQGLDVLVGWVDTHGRADTEAMLAGPEVLPRQARAHRGAQLWEFDLDSVLARRPALVVVDELAHSNAPGSRHPKRWQDVEELLAAGIDVYSAMNVQHLDSLNDVVARVTGVAVHLKPCPIPCSTTPTKCGWWICRRTISAAAGCRQGVSARSGRARRRAVFRRAI